MLAAMLPLPLALGVLGVAVLGGCATGLPLHPEPLGPSRYGAAARAIEVDGAQVVYTVEGREGGPAVLLVHPWAGSLRVWDAVAPALAAEHRVVRVDLPGHGASDKPDVSYDIPRGARAVVAVLDALGIGRASLVGNSLGGGVALAVIGAHPERVDRLVLIDALGGGPVPGLFGHFITTFFTAAMFHGVDTGLITFFADTFVFERTGPWTDAFLSQLLSERAGDGGWGFSRAVASYLRNAVDFDATAWLEAVAAPTLVVWGDSDLVIREGAGEHLAQLIPAASWVVLEDCGHMPEVDCPGALTPLLVDFLTPAE